MNRRFSRTTGSKTDRNKNFFSAKCKSHDKQIDECVYELYVLSEKERGVIGNT